MDTREEALYKSKILAQELGCYSQDTAWNPETVEQCLREKPAEEILRIGT